MSLPDDDRRAVGARLATHASPGVGDVLADAIDGDEELREVLVDVDGEVVALTDRRALVVGSDGARAFAYDHIEVRRRGEGLGIDAVVEGDRLALLVARSTLVRLGVVAEGNPPSRATWLPDRTPVRAPEPEPVPTDVVPAPPDTRPTPARPRDEYSPPPGWHPDPSGRHWWRWWDGGGWTEHVADGGAPYVDPLPPR
jgi:hypothetical protein